MNMTKLFLAITLLIGLFSTATTADRPSSCAMAAITRTYIYDATSSTNTYTFLDSGSGVATSANPDLELSSTNQTSLTASASSTIGIDAEVVATSTIGVSIGWTTSITVKYNLNWDPGVAFTAELQQVYTTWTGPCALYDEDFLVPCWCTPEQPHWHHGTWTASKYNGTRVVADPPASP